MILDEPTAGLDPQGVDKVLEILNNGWYKIVWAEAPNGYAYTSNQKKYYEYISKEQKSTGTIKEPASVKNPQFGATEIPDKQDASLAGTYKITASTALNVRKGPGANFDVLYALPASTKVIHEGYYSISDLGTKWIYIIAKVKSITVEGFASEKYLKKV